MASTDSTWKDELRKAIKEEMRSFLDRDKPGPSGSNVQGPSSSKKSDKTLTFEEFYVKREEARRGDFKPKKKKIKLSSDKKESIPKQVEVKVALAYQDDGIYKRCQGKVQIVRVNTTSSREDLLQSAIEKHATFDKTFDETLSYTLLYPDSEVHSIPGTKDIFTLCAYKEAIGKEYKRLTFFLIPTCDIVSSDDDEDLKPAFSSESKASLSSQPKDSSSLKGKGKSPMHSQVTNVPSSSVSSSYSSYMEVIHDWDDDMDPDMDPDYLAAIEASLLDQTNDDHVTEEKASEEKAIEVLQRFISKTLDDKDDEMVKIVISRKILLMSTLRAIERKSFSFYKPFLVTFSGEDGIDAGGPKREFFRLLMQSLRGMGIFDGNWFVHDLELLKQRKYELAGKLVSWSILHGGSGPKCLSIEAYCVVQGKLIDQTQVIEVVSDAKLKDILKSIKAANEENFLEVINKHDDEIADYGYSKIYTSKFGDKEKILESLLNQSFLFSVYADMQHFRAGMNMIGGLGDTVFENYNVFQAVLSNNIDKLTSALLQKHYTVCFSEAGSNRKEKELETIYSFDVFQKDLEEGEMEDLHLSDLLVFMTGADSIPPLGFDSKITVEFYDVIDGERRFPWVLYLLAGPLPPKRNQ
ncbi:hypothetical protein QZH41_000470 [Actinostola sp. cb2023]|nr:hypothetical protein QZH41_000470 [Actinostola sp. cb2023]